MLSDLLRLRLLLRTLLLSSSLDRVLLLGRRSLDLDLDLRRRSLDLDLDRRRSLDLDLDRLRSLDLDLDLDRLSPRRRSSSRSRWRSDRDF